MKATTTVEKTEITHSLAATRHGQGNANALEDTEAEPQAWQGTAHQGRSESELRAAARRKGLTLKELADRMGVSYKYLSQVSSGSRPWTNSLRERAMEVLGEVPGRGVVYRQGGVVNVGQSTYIRERAREVGLSLGELADRVGVSASYLSQVARGKRHLGPRVQVRVEAQLQGPIKVEAAQCPTVDPRTLWDRMDSHGWSQNETARRAGISSSLLSQIINGRRTPSGPVLKKLHEVLFRPTAAELVVPAEVKVMAWKKGRRNGVVVQGAGGPGSGTIRTGGRVPEGAEVEYAYRAGYDSRGRVSVTHLVDERGCSALLDKPQTTSAGSGKVPGAG